MNHAPTQALRRTRRCLTAPAFTVAFPPAVQVPRRSGVSQSLRALGVMRARFLISVFFGLLFSAVGHAFDADYSSLPDWQRAILDETTFELRTLPPAALFPSGAPPEDLSTDGFLLFVCSARQNLGKRLLWIDAEVEFSNGYTRKFSSVPFHLLTGSAVAISKLDFPVAPALTIKSLKITSGSVK